MSSVLWALLSGLCFGAGLAISGMTDPEVVLAFLTISTDWNPALIAVMGSAVVVSFVGFALTRKRSRPLAGEQFHEPETRSITPRLIFGSALFGVGWALSGYCPGPALIGAASLDFRALIFITAYWVGVILFEVLSGSSPTEPVRVGAVSADG